MVSNENDNIVHTSQANTHFTCSSCGHHPVKTHFGEPTRSRMITKQVCFTCDFWLGLIDNKGLTPENRFIIEGHHYVALPNDPHPLAMRGFSGRRFEIKTDDGRTIVTNNLWHQGEIPERFRDRLPNNAVFDKKTRAYSQQVLTTPFL
jgi:hypothetical protein